MISLITCLVWTFAFLPLSLTQNANITIFPAATGFEADSTAFYYNPSPRILANDGSAAEGGFRVFSVSTSPPFSEQSHEKTGRSKVVVPVYDVGGKDYYVTIAAPDSVMRVFQAESVTEVESARKKVLGDWSTLCVWRSTESGISYLYLFGKKTVVQFVVQSRRNTVQLLEVQTFSIPIEGEACSISSLGKVYFSAEDQPLYAFQAAESATPPGVQTIAEDIEVAALATYRSTSGDFLFIAHDEEIDVYDANFSQKGSIALSGISDLSIEGGLSVLQASSPGYPAGAIAFAFEGVDDTGVAAGSLEGALASLGITPNTNYTPKNRPCKRCTQPISEQCSFSGFSQGYGSCQCFAGFSGRDCSKITCKNSCSGHGKCAGPNTCQCKPGWSGPDCSFKAVKAKYETDANGGDGDDPAIWIHPTKAQDSKIITTTKSEEGAGFAAFDLKGTLLQHVNAEEPNNVDVIYNFTVGERKADLTFAACRGDNTLCLLEINSTGLLLPVPGGIQPTPADYEVYGSCTYRSHKTDRQYLFVNNKDAEYLQYELTSTSNGTLQTTLVRTFTGGSGGQVEGCVADDEAGYLFLGEEPEGIWRYDAEPDDSDTGVQIAKVGDGKLAADVEGLTLVPAADSSAGYLFVSSQGISSYLVYERAPPHNYVMTFTIVDNEETGVDHVSNTDGISAVGNKLNDDFPTGLFVTHDDANELGDGGTAEEASFKLVSLEDILGKNLAGKLGYS